MTNLRGEVLGQTSESALSAPAVIATDGSWLRSALSALQVEHWGHAFGEGTQ